MEGTLPTLILAGGISQLVILSASALVPFRLHWRTELQLLSRLHRQMYWVYGGYIVLSIIAFALISIFNASELAKGSGLARGFCLYVAVFWGIRLALQAYLDVREHLTTWWLKLGYLGLTSFFLALTVIYGWAALSVAGSP